MSEYQYYEFQALDRPLTQEQMSKLRAHSSRARITPQSFINEYDWGNFRGNPREWMEQYFDAFLYYANWGSRRFMLRLPAKLLDLQTVAPYCDGENLSCFQKNDHVVLSFDVELETFEWAEEITLASLVPIRSDLMRGNHRALYLGWLVAVQFGEVPDGDLEPSVPPGLGKLNTALDSLADFLGIDTDLISAAAERSPEQVSTLSGKEIDEWVRTLPSAEKDAIIVRLIDEDDPYLTAELRRRAISEVTGTCSDEGSRRTVGEILARAETIAGRRRKKEAKWRAREKAMRERAAAEARKKRLESLVGKENELWATVAKLIAAKQAKPYDQAASLLQDLHDLAELQSNKPDFEVRIRALQRENSTKTALMERLRKAKFAGKIL